jgi:hypothetical protein
LSTVPSALSRDFDFIAPLYAVVASLAAPVTGMTNRLGLGLRGFARGHPGQAIRRRR